MPETPGLSFSPLGSDPSKRQDGNAPTQPIQEAIRVLSLRVPKINGGAPSLAPNALLMGQGSQGIPSPMGSGQTNLGLEELLRRIFGLQPTGSFAPAPTSGTSSPTTATASYSGGTSAPAPSIIPGITDPTAPLPPLVEDPTVAPAPAPAPYEDPLAPTAYQGTQLGTALSDKYGW